MAINTTFGSGAVLTAAQMNNLPWGVAAKAKRISNFSLSAVFQVIPDTTVTWTANLTRVYKITATSYFAATAGTGSIFTKISNGTGGRIQEAGTYVAGGANSYPSVNLVVYETGLSGLQTRRIECLFQGVTTAQLLADSTYPCTIIVEDVGAA